MVKTCCVKNCDIGPRGNVTCFRFPNNRFLKRKWIDAIGLSNKLTANSTVCIKHFQEDDYDIVRGRPRLKAKVIPSVFCESDKHSLSQCITEDDLISNEINTDITLKSIQKDNSNALEVIDLQNEDTTNLQNDNSADARSEGSKELGNVRKIELEKECGLDEEVSEKLQNDSSTLHVDVRTGSGDEDSTESQNQNTLESQNESIKESHKNDTTEIQSLPSSDVQNGSEVELLNDKTQNEGSTKSEEEGSVQNKKEDVEEDECRKTKPNGVIEGERKKVKGYQDSFVESAIKPRGAVEDLTKDIEEIIVNYHIKQTRPLHAAEPDSIELDRPDEEGEPGAEEVLLQESDPVFIEVAVQGAAGDRAGSPRDCLMVLESVQVELDPSTFLADGDPDDCHETVDLADDDDDHDHDRRPDPISLLTSSDEDEVIIQEPHIDTVEVSDETDEDDMPLVKLLKRRKKKKPAIAVWNAYEYFCMDCQYTATSKQEYKAHTAKHSTILQVCEICDYTTASKSQFSRHKRKHKDDKKLKCHLCDYKARHNMSLIYHLKSHRALTSAKKGFKCDKCGFKSDVKTVVLKHVKLCTSNIKKYSCDKCVYETKRPSDLRRHMARRHNEDQDDDEEFVP